MKRLVYFLVLAAMVTACTNSAKKEEMKTEIQKKADEYASFALKTDLSVLTEKEKQMLPFLFEAASIMEDLFWQQAYGNKDEILAKATEPAMEKMIRINYGPWERLNGNEPFVDGVGVKPAGAKFYPEDMTKEEFEALADESKTGLYSLIQRNADGGLAVVPYHVAYGEQLSKAAELILKAVALSEDEGLKKYLESRANALLTDDFYASDIAWLDMKTNTIDFVVGPIESYEDHLFGYKASYESFILIKDKVWSQRLEKYAALLPGLQKALPCADVYKSETPGVDADMNVYDAVFYAGDCNAGSKTIAINLPNDEQVRANKGSRKLQLKNSMQAKFEKILVPISELLIDESQRKYVKFDAFFENVMFHEVSHGLGLGKTIDGTQTVRQALKEVYTSIEESKADICGLWCVNQLNAQGEFEGKDMMDNFVTFMAGIFRSVRFGAASAHGKANMMCFYYLEENGAFTRDAATGTYKIDFEKMKSAMNGLAELVLTLQGDGNYDLAKKMIEEKGTIRPELQADLDRIAEAGIPRDIVFEQGPSVLGL